MKTKGFTLIVLMFAIAILSILADVVIPAYKHKKLCESNPASEQCSQKSTRFVSGVGTTVSEECRGGVKYLISEKAITPMVDQQGLPYPC